MAHSHTPYVCDRCGATHTSLRRFCKPCREAMQPLTNEYNKDNHGFSGLVNQANMERWYFWAKRILIERKGMPETFERHVAGLVKRHRFEVPDPSQTRYKAPKEEY